MGQVTVNREKVLDHIIRSQAPLDTYSISGALTSDDKIIPERSVRAAVIWLVYAGYLIKADKPVKRVSVNEDGREQTYNAYLYIYTGKPLPIRTVRRDPEERDVQKWDDVNDGGVLLQNIIFRKAPR